MKNQIRKVKFRNMTENDKLLRIHSDYYTLWNLSAVERLILICQYVFIYLLTIACLQSKSQVYISAIVQIIRIIICIHVYIQHNCLGKAFGEAVMFI